MKKQHMGQNILSTALHIIAGMFLVVVIWIGVPAVSYAEDGVTQLSGAGTTADPYLVEDIEDLQIVCESVASGYTFAGENLRIEADITLPDDWQGIGALKEGTTGANSGKNINPFSGTLDGGGYTVTAAEGGQPLLGYVREATIRNLRIAGKDINGNGLIGKYVSDKGESGTGSPKTADVENVTIVSGTSIRGSGIVSGYASLHNLVDITDCTVEPGVVIGSQKNRSTVGSFGGDYNGRITGCKSAATVYGVNYVGGIMGCKGSSMSETSVTNCTFTGQVIASGTYAGGIAGGGYGGTYWGIDTAPNAIMLSVINCQCTGTIEASDVVGGIVGYETSLQVWKNGIGYVRSNLFTGRVSATDGTCIGGIAGAFRGLDRYNIIEDNFYAEDCGADRGIGSAEYVDTSCTTHETTYGVNYFNTSEEIPVFEGVNSSYSGNLLADHNRTDDPLGADAQSLARSVTSEQLKDGTVTEWLNEAAGSLGNWVQSGEYPVLQEVSVVIGIDICDGYQTDYEIGDSLDASSLRFTLTWSDGNTSEIAGNDTALTITGFDSSSKAILTLTASYGSVQTSFIVRILEPDNGETMSLYFTLLGDDKHGPDADCGVHTRARGNLTEWIPQKKFEMSINCTAEDLIRKALTRAELEMEGRNVSGYGNLYISGIQIPPEQLEDPSEFVMLCEKDNGPNSGWMYAVNDEEPEVGVSQYFLEDGDELILFYTDDYTQEQSSQPYQEITPGSTQTVDDNTYVVISAAASDSAGTVELVKAKNTKKIIIPKYVELTDGNKYNVIKVGKKAFTEKNIRTVVVGGNVSKLAKQAFAKSQVTKVILKTKLLKKSSVKGCLKGSSVKTVKVKVSSSKKQNKKYLKKYKKIFTKANAGRKVKVK